MLRRMVGDAVDIEFSGDPELGRTHADPGQIDQVVMNLVVNARDAMPEGGTVRIRTDNVAQPPARVRDTAGAPVASGGYVRLRIEDTGVGMEPGLIARVFEPFFTTKAKGEGTGLGLATVHGVVKQTGGLIGVESRPDEGATFSVYLPRMADDEVPAPATVAPRAT